MQKKYSKKVKLFNTVPKKANSLKTKIATKKALVVKYLLQKLLDNSEFWLQALQSSIECRFQLKKKL